MAVTRAAMMISAVPMIRMILVDTMMDVMMAVVARVAWVPLEGFDEAAVGSGLVDGWDDWRV